MATPSWVCLECGKEFIPVINESDISFNCPACGSPKTIAKRLSVLNSESVGDSLDNRG